ARCSVYPSHTWRAYSRPTAYVPARHLAINARDVGFAPESSQIADVSLRPLRANTGLCVLVIARRCAHALSKFAPDTNSGGIEREENSFCCCSSYDGLGTSSRGAMSPSYADGHPGRPTCLQRLGRPRNAGALWRR